MAEETPGDAFLLVVLPHLLIGKESMLAIKCRRYFLSLSDVDMHIGYLARYSSQM